MHSQVYPSIVTTTNGWKKRILEIKELGITEVAFFPTCLKHEDRGTAYSMLLKSGIKYIPLVHLRSDMNQTEIKFLHEKFGTKIFNLHTPLDLRYRPKYDLSPYKHMIYVENSSFPWQDTPKDWAGLCLDVAHLESARLDNAKVLTDWEEALTKYRVGVWHVSAVYNPAIYNKSLKQSLHDVHHFDQLYRFDYIKKFKTYAPEVIALEIENPISEQINAKKYIEKMLD